MSKRTLAAKDFVHLHNHTQYSLLDGLTKIPALMEHVKQSGMSAVAITDHGTLSGLIEFYKEALAIGIKPVLGIEAYVAPRGYKDKDQAKDKAYYHVILLAMNNTGYQNLMRLSTIANLEGFYYKPRLDHDLLKKYNDGLIVLSGCIGGEVGDALRQGQYDKARKIASWYSAVFGDRYYLEVQDHGHPNHPSAWPEQVAVTEKTFKLAEELKIQCVVTSDAHYLKHADQAAHEILLCVQTGSFISDEKRMSLKEFDLYVTPAEEIISRWGAEHPEVIMNSKKIADKCAVNIELNKILIPKFPVPSGEDEKSFLDLKVYRGLAWRYGGATDEKAAKLSLGAAKKTLTPAVLKRAKYEMAVIDKMNFNGFFLIVADFVNWGKTQGIIFGPGRGSAASSIVAYALNITELDPLQYDLLFERFLNPGRISMPDFDIDIQDNRRDEVIQYCVDKYGTEQVANIVTFGRMAARNAVRDVARVLQVPYAEADRLAKMLPPPVQGRHILLKTSLKANNELKLEYNRNDTAKRVFDLAVQLEGTIRSHGVHAAGVVIAPDELVKFTPLEMAQKGVVATQYAMGPIEEIGLLKIDFLGLSNLTIINNALRIIRRAYGRDITLSHIPLDDSKTFNLLAQGDTTGVFQFESAGMKRYLKELRPNRFTDIIAMVALYRPGPMAEFPRFIAGKNDPATIKYLHPSLEPILRDTYGVIVFQEQIIALLQLIAGYSPGEADLVRKAIGKKKREIMSAEHPRFIEGCLKQGLTKNGAEKLWGLIQPFADYSFNKAHAACYALIAYQTAYLKANFATAFMAALMTSDYDDTDRLSIEITECKHLGIEVLAPNINQSFMEFAVVPNEPKIRFGLAAIKNVGSAAVEEILRARSNGAFIDLEDFCARVNPRVVNKKAMESLVKAGAFDDFLPRHILLHNLDVILAYAARLQKQAASGQTDIFGSGIDESVGKARLALDKSAPEIPLHEHLLWERELLGLYLSQHPLEAYTALLTEQTMPLEDLLPTHHNRSVTVGGTVQEVREITTKVGQLMAFVRIATQSSQIELVLFPSAYQQTTGLWVRDRVIIAKGKVSSQNRDGTQAEEIKVLVNDAREVTHQQAQAYQPTGKKIKKIKASSASIPSLQTSKVKAKLYVRIAASEDIQLLSKLREAIDNSPGDTEVILVVGPEAQKQALRLPIRFDASKDNLTVIERLIGSENLKLQ